MPKSIEASAEFPADAVFIDVLPEESYQVAHLPNAANACVYGVDFIPRCAELAPDKAAPVIVYGTSARSGASKTAAEKLEAAGYTNVHVLVGGLEEWTRAQRHFTTGDSNPPTPVPDGTYRVDTGKSVIKWAGRNFNSVHSGTLRLADGSITIRDGALDSSVFNIDLRTIKNTDIADEAMSKVLVDHLASDDFFNVAAHPAARLEIQAAAPISGAADDKPNFLLAGTLRLNGHDAPLSFPAHVRTTANGTLEASAIATINRTHWGIIYGSNQFYEALLQHFVSDMITLDIAITARR